MKYDRDRAMGAWLLIGCGLVQVTVAVLLIAT